MTDSFYKHHVFFCQNRREEGERPCCAARGSVEAFAHAKGRIRALGMDGPGKVRINKSGCLDRCELGPVVVVYPQGTWYTYVDDQDIDEIVESHLRDGKIVERLLIDPQ